MQFIDLQSQYQQLHVDIQARLTAVHTHGRYINGPEVTELEQQLAKYVGVKHCIAVANGTDALLIAMMALGIKAGDEVITSPFSFFATAEMIALLGAVPVFVDIDPLTYNIDASKIAPAITPKTKAILPVNIFGQAADYAEIRAIAQQYGLPIIEDAAQSLGARYHNEMSGSLGTISCTSFYPSKPLGCYGDGGALFTNDDEHAVALRQIANHGQSATYVHQRIGVNSRLATMQAAILLAKLTVFEQELATRQKIAGLYSAALSDCVKVPYVKPSNYSAYAQYTIAVEATQRTSVIAQLRDAEIPTAIHYPSSMHQQPAIAGLCVTHNVVQAITAASQVISLPFHPYLTEENVEHVVSVLHKISLLTSA